VFDGATVTKTTFRYALVVKQCKMHARLVVVMTAKTPEARGPCAVGFLHGGRGFAFYFWSKSVRAGPAEVLISRIINKIVKRRILRLRLRLVGVATFQM
jgi:hypothetical protein